MNKEIWKPIKDYEGLYEISNFGKVKSLSRNIYNLKNKKFNRKTKEKILNCVSNKKGYLTIQLYKNGKQKQYFVHRLVAQAFINNFQNKPQINHIDGNKKNNKVDNLEWVSNLENNKHSWLIGLRTNNTVCHKNNKDKRLTSIIQYSLNGLILKKWNCINDVTKKYGYNHSNIIACCKNKRATAYGFVWKYKKIERNY